MPVECSIACTPERYSIVILQLIPPLSSLILPPPRYYNETILASNFRFYDTSLPDADQNFRDLIPREIVHFARRRMKMNEAA